MISEVSAAGPTARPGLTCQVEQKGEWVEADEDWRLGSKFSLPRGSNVVPFWL